jgi:hypothetical protein
MEALDSKRARGGDRRSEAEKSNAQHCAIENPATRSSGQTGEILGISSRKVEMARTVMEHAEEATKEAVKQGDLSINQAYQKTQKDRKKSTAKDKKTKAKESVSEEVQGVQQVADENKESTNFAPVFLSLEHFGALRELGGSIEEHVAKAIELYLKSLQNQCEQTSTKDDPEDDDEEYYDPADYIDE